MSWILPITDRTFEDVNRVLYLNERMNLGTATSEEVAEWKRDLKGSFNKSDMNRLLNNISILNTEMKLNLEIPQKLDLPTEKWFSDLLNCVIIIRDYYILSPKIPKSPKMPLNQYNKINDIEKILAEVYRLIHSIVYQYCGEGYYCGNTIGLL